MDKLQHAVNECEHKEVIQLLKEDKLRQARQEIFLRCLILRRLIRAERAEEVYSVDAVLFEVR